MAMYTFIMEYQGGTYVSQVKARSIRLAIRKWAQELTTDNILRLGPKIKQKMLEKLDNDPDNYYRAYALTGLKNVWCINVPLPFSPRTLINAVKTDIET